MWGKLELPAHLLVTAQQANRTGRSRALAVLLQLSGRRSHAGLRMNNSLKRARRDTSSQHTVQLHPDPVGKHTAIPWATRFIASV